MCADGWYYEDGLIDGECPDCGTPTYDGTAQSGCHWSPVDCETCGSAICDGSC